jgi:peptidoglycan hydrolase-like protein with peptidoglycan-binding domain
LKRIVLAALALVVCVATGWFAARATLSPPSAPDATSRDLTYEVQEGQVKRVLEFSATASYERRLLAYGSASGVVTATFIRAGQTVSAGARLYAVDERPVFAAAGTVPAFRDLTTGVEGRDVAQLQAMLVALGFLRSTPDGDFDLTTATAVRSWQEATGRDQTGSVAQGDVIFVPRLPAKIQLADGITVGQRVGPGQESVFGLSASPRFEIVLNEEQKDLVPLDAPVAIAADGRQWRGDILDATSRGPSDLVLRVGKSNGDPLCGRDCDAVPAGKESTYPAEITAVPSTTGPLVPAAALHSDPAGQTFVTTDAGQGVPVTVLASDGGWSVVDGISVGDVLALSGAGSESPSGGSNSGDSG